MRPTLLLLAAGASYSFATRTGLTQHFFEELVARTSCGDEKSISKCLRSSIDLGRPDEIEQCYLAGGCSKADATEGAVWFAHEYREYEGSDEGQELRRRAESSDTDEESTTKNSAKTTARTTARTTAKSTAAETTESSAAASSAPPSSTAAASTKAAPTTTDSPTSSTTSESTPSTASPTANSQTSTTTGSTTGSLVCSTTNTITTSVCSVSAGRTISCMATTSLVLKCAAGLLCSTSTANVCMKIDNTVSGGGIAIAIIFGTGIVGAVLAIIVMNFKSSRRQKMKDMERQAFMASGYKSKAKAVNVEVTPYAPHAGHSDASLPLIQMPQGEYFDQGRAGTAPPKLHLGLESLGQQYNGR